MDSAAKKNSWPKRDLFKTLTDAHLATAHRGRDKTELYIRECYSPIKRWLKIGFLMHVEIDLTKLEGQTSKHWFIFANTMWIGWGHSRDFTVVKRALQEYTSQHLLCLSKADMSSWKLSMLVFFMWSVRWEWKVLYEWWHAMRAQSIHLVNKIETIFVF